MVTGLYAGILAFIFIGLVFRIIAQRLKYKAGDGGVDDIGHALRVHANFVEIIPIILIMMFLMEQDGMPPWFLHIYGIVLIVSRLFYAWNVTMGDGRSTERMYGVILRLSLLAIGGVVLIFMYIK